MPFAEPIPVPIADSDIVLLVMRLKAVEPIEPFQMRSDKFAVFVFVENTHCVREQRYGGRYDRLLVVDLVFRIVRTRFRNRIDMLAEQFGDFFYVRLRAVFAKKRYEIRKDNGVGIMLFAAPLIIAFYDLFYVYYIQLVLRQIV